MERAGLGALSLFFLAALPSQSLALKVPLPRAAQGRATLIPGSWASLVSCLPGRVQPGRDPRRWPPSSEVHPCPQPACSRPSRDLHACRASLVAQGHRESPSPRPPDMPVPLCTPGARWQELPVLSLAEAERWLAQGQEEAASKGPSCSPRTLHRVSRVSRAHPEEPVTPQP